MNYLKKDVYLLKTIISSVLAVTGIVTFVFAILGLANVSKIEPSIAIRFIAGSALIGSGAIVLILNYAKQPHKVDIRDVLLGSIVVGMGVFLVLNEGSESIKTIITLILPMGLACAGAGIFIKGFIVLLTLKSAKEDDGKNLKIRGFFLMFFGAIFTIGGTLFCVFRKEPALINVIWLVAGLCIASSSFIVLIQSAKELKKILKKEKAEAKIEKANREDDEDIKVIEQKDNTEENN